MPSCCVVTACSNRYAQSSDISYHKFPTDETICQKWIEFTGRGQDWRPSRWSSICSRHFDRSCFKNYLVKRSLKHDAIPTILDTEEIAPVPATKGLIVNNVNQINAAGLLKNPNENEVQVTSLLHQDEIESPIHQTQEIHETPVASAAAASSEDLIPDYEGPEEDEDPELINLEGLGQFVESLCRLCARTFDQKQLVCYSSFLNLIIKCFPTLNLEYYEYFPRQICIECREKLINFSIFINKTMNAQKYLTERLILNLPNETGQIENKCIVPSIKQEPIVMIKEEKTDWKMLGLKDKINFKDSKNCEIIKIVSFDSPKLVQNSNSNKADDDDIEILNPPMKVEEIIEDDDHREHNYVRPLPKIEILEERVFKTEPYFQAQDFQTESREMKQFESFLPAVKFCDSCNFGFLRVADYLAHKIKVHKAQKQLRKRCGCGRVLRSGLLLKHYRFCPLKRLKCRNCGVHFTKTSQFIRHTCKEETIEENIEILDFTSNPTLLNELDESQYDVIYVAKPATPIQSHPSTYSCSQCGRSFSRSFLCETHERTHRARNQWTALCEKCNKIFDRDADLAWHQKFECAFKESYEATVVAHSQKQTFDCQICGARLSNLYNLKVHENIHTKEVAFQCHKCKKNFSSKQNLAQHQLTHSQERAFNCNLCTKVFKRAGGLKQHVNSFHLNIKPHICPTCSHAYALKADMLRCRHSALKAIQ